MLAYRLLLLAAVLVVTTAENKNMNGEYAVTAIGKIDTDYNSDFASKGYEYFDVWAPEIATHYGEVFWTDQGTQPLPADVIKRFDGKVIAIQGYEQNQVMVSPVGKPGASPENDVSVPINWAYNHHYCAWMGGKHSERKEIDTPEEDIYGGGAHGMKKMWATVDKEDQSGRKFADVAQTSWFISEGNGGESRKSYHGYPEGFAQLIESPQNWHITPMQIDTRNRVHGAGPGDVHKCTNMSGVSAENGKPCAGYEPRQARYGRGWGGVDGTPADPGDYSGILECPCNSRYGGDPMFYPKADTRIVTAAITAISSGACGAGKDFKSAQACYDGIAELGFIKLRVTNTTKNDPSMPAGCQLVTNADGTAVALYNTGGTPAGCAKSATMVAGSTSTVNNVSLGLTTKVGKATMTRNAKGVFCQKNKNGVLKEFRAKSEAAADETIALEACEAFCAASSVCNACSVDSVHHGTGPGYMQWAAIPACGNLVKWDGQIAGDVSQKTTTGDVTITLSGPADRWFAVGLNAKTMFEQPYTIVVNSTGVSERKLGTCGTEANHCAGTPLAASVKIVSTNVVNNVRTVVLTRPVAGATKDHYSFGAATVNYISAAGISTGAQAFAYHGPTGHDVLTLSFSAPTGPTCACDLGGDGELCWNPAVVNGSGAWGAPKTGNGCGKFKKGCVARQADMGKGGEPSGDLLSEQNPTCNSAHYSGGLTCCKHKRLMIDADQEVQPELLRYHMKFRFWYQEYKPAGPPVSKSAAALTNASHVDLPRIYWQTEANAGEYDIPPAFYTKGQPKIVGYPDVGPYPELTPGSECTGDCPNGPDCDCVHTITYNKTVSNMRLIYAGGHCHAPACIGIWLYRNDPGHEMELLCHTAPIFGNGTGTNTKSGLYDEKGYLALPPCLWGNEPGLAPDILLPKNTEMVSIKKNRNTHAGHFGEMASWQMRGTNF